MRRRLRLDELRAQAPTSRDEPLPARHRLVRQPRLLPTRVCTSSRSTFDDRSAAQLFEEGVARTLSIQGPRGEWPWLIRTSSGVVVDPYPVFSVHQDSMAMLFLLPANDRGIARAAEAIPKSLAWCFGANELAERFYVEEPLLRVPVDRASRSAAPASPLPARDDRAAPSQPAIRRASSPREPRVPVLSPRLDPLRLGRPDWAPRRRKKHRRAARRGGPPLASAEHVRHLRHSPDRRPEAAARRADVLVRMTDAMTHRGPNDRGLHLAPGVALGVRRLSIVDVAGGHQPFANEDGRVWAVQNGELYNHDDDPRASLRGRGHRFREPLRHRDPPPPLRGGRGRAARPGCAGSSGSRSGTDAPARALVARDRLGVKPIYYAVVDDLVVFASELKSILASGLVDTSLDLEAIDAYLTLGYFPAPLTPLAQVRKLLAGSPARRRATAFAIEPYWQFPPPAPDPGMTRGRRRRAAARPSSTTRCASD